MNREATSLAGARHIQYDTLGSTNAEALALARAGERGPVWISARMQSAGRGRRASTWTSPAGNLYATLMLTEPAPADTAPQLSFVAALAVHDALAERAPALGPALKVKWPNDLLIGGSKVSGILIESENVPLFTVAIGIGINCVSHPADTLYPATDLSAERAPVQPDILLTALAQAMNRRLAQWQRGTGFAAIRADWLARAAGIGGEIRVRLPERDFSGHFRGLDESGCLLVQPSGGPVETITAGDVFGLGADGA